MSTWYGAAVHVILQARDSGRSENSVDDLIASARHARDLGLGFSIPQLLDLDAMTALAVVGREVSGLDVGTAVVPTYARHPVVMAMQALTAQAATEGRFTLGIGLSHPSIVAGAFGLPYSRPVRHMQEYLEILTRLLHDGDVEYEGELYSARSITPMKLAGAAAPKVLVAALGSQMLRVTGRIADGTTLWMTGPRTVAEHIVPTITHAADEVHRAPPQVVVGLPVSVTANVERSRARAAIEYSWYGTLPAYRAMLDKEGAGGPADIAIIGDEEAVAQQIRALGQVGATAFRASVFGSDEERKRTFALLGELARS